MKHKTGCKAEFYRTVKRTPESVSHHKCICAKCGVELDPITLEPAEIEKKLTKALSKTINNI